MSEANKAVVRRLYEEVWNGGKTSLLDSLIGAAYVDHNPAPGQPPGAAGAKARVESLRAAFPEVRYVLEDLVGEDDLVAARYHWRGAHKKTFLGIQPSGKTILVRGMDFYRLRDGRIVERWENVDELGMLSQLGDFA